MPSPKEKEGGPKEKEGGKLWEKLTLRELDIIEKRLTQIRDNSEYYNVNIAKRLNELATNITSNAELSDKDKNKAENLENNSKARA